MHLSPPLIFHKHLETSWVLQALRVHKGVPQKSVENRVFLATGTRRATTGLGSACPTSDVREEYGRLYQTALTRQSSPHPASTKKPEALPTLSQMAGDEVEGRVASHACCARNRTREFTHAAGGAPARRRIVQLVHSPSSRCHAVAHGAVGATPCRKPSRERPGFSER